MSDPKTIELSVVMPCLNEVETVGSCVQAAHVGAERAGIGSYEIIVADNGSSDGSQSIAEAEGARVVQAEVRGYGAALRAGIQAARGEYVIMGDSDNSYDFTEIKPFMEHLRAGATLVMGSRLKGEIQSKAMPFLHRYIGNPILTFLANMFFRTKLSDYHCGLRGFRRLDILELNLRTNGMEFASELVIRTALSGKSITEIPIAYRPAGRTRPPHLNTWRDGWRHLRFMLLYSPRWVILYPGLLLFGGGLITSIALIAGPIRIAGLTFDVHTLLITSTMVIVGFQLILMSVFSRSYATRVGLLPSSPSLERRIEGFSLGEGIVVGLLLCAAGLAIYVLGVVVWGRAAFGPIVDYQTTIRIVVSGTTLLVLGIQLVFGSFVLSQLGLRKL
jgi:glycosyltransferase involved in cell wall biosynthesis